MRVFWKYPVALLVSVLALAAPASAEQEIENMNKHFAVASKHFGDGAVQLQSRHDGADATTHSIYHFDCKNKKYDVLFSGLADPEDFPMDTPEPAATPFDENDDVAPLAQHVCTEHGYPLLKW